MTDEQHAGRCRMAEDVKAVAWRCGNDGDVWALRKTEPRGWRFSEPLYPQQAIDALRAEVERLEGALSVTQESHKWVNAQRQRAEAQAAELAEVLRHVRNNTSVTSLQIDIIDAALSRAANDTQAGGGGA